MDYKKKYEELVGKIEKAYLFAQTDSTKAVLEEIRSELKESEDERIRKAIHIYLDWLDGRKDYAPKGEYTIRDMIAWLEKQGEPKSYSWKPSEEQFEALDYAYNSCSDTERGNYYEGVLETLIEDLHRLEKQGQVKESFISQHENKTCKENSNSLTGKDEQKPADNIEPKFKAGDWIIRSTEGFKHNTYLVKEVKDYYICEDLKGRRVTFTFNDVHKNFKLWGISDAKDGDVLCYKDEISLYKHDIKNCTKQETIFGGFVYHCCYDGKRFITDSFYSLTEQDKIDIHPATKEQRDTIEKAMADAGYTFDFDKKELKKIEQKPAEWSEEDEKTLQGIWDEILANKHDAKECEWKTYDRFLDWLKSLKDRVGCEANCTTTWKPSKIQLECLYDAIEHYQTNGYPASKLNELYEQMSKIYKL